MIRWLEKKGFFHLLSARFLTQFLGFGTVLLVAKFLSPTELGEIKIIQSYANVFAVFAGLGISTAVLKLCSENREYEEKEQLLRYSLWWSVGSIVITMALLAALIYSGKLTTSRHLSLWLMVYSAAIPLMVFTDLLAVFLQALKRIKEMAKAQVIIKLQSFIIIVISTWKWGFYGFIFSTIVAFLLGLWPLLRQVGTGFLFNKAIKAPGGFWNLALFSVLANGVSLVGSYGDIFILDHFAIDRVEIGFYSLATMFLLAATQVTGTVQSIVTPYFSQHADDKEWFCSQLWLNQKRMVFLAIVVAMGVYAGGWVLVSYFYGSTYSSTLSYLRILMVKYVIYSSYAIIGPAILGLGMMRYNFRATAIATPIGLVLCYLLLTKYGIGGVAWAQVITALITMILVQIISRHAIKKHFSIN